MGLETGEWLSITDYALQKKKSISTVRRYIKANRLKHKLVDGKYLIYTNVHSLKISSPLKSSVDLAGQISQLEMSLRQREEEIGELKMLVSLYENNSRGLPEIPTMGLDEN